MRALALPLMLVAGPAFADLSDVQQAAYDAVLPALTEALGAQGDAGTEAFAPALTECVVTTAKRREVRALGDGDLGDDDMALVNDIMTRPKTQGCLTKALQ
ncbi:hypothetical protein [Shimia ponticola]|uniref:hypothetical protein n=1 Tax=Shimia ponticola TaxID=2582893 RepID=UPI0011BE183B|nr:hypothetical protein [Shimia ponticola]